MPLMKSVAGDMEVAISSIRREDTNLVAVGKFGVWEAEIEVSPADVIEMIPMALKGGAVGFVLNLPYLNAKSKRKNKTRGGINARDSYNKKLFMIGAIWNWLFSIGGIAIFTLYKQYMTLFTPSAPNNTMFAIVAFALVFAFGIGYYWVAQNPAGNRGIIKMGILGKLLVFGIMIYGYYGGQITTLSLMGGIGDFIFTLFFLNALSYLPKE